MAGRRADRPVHPQPCGATAPSCCDARSSTRAARWRGCRRLERLDSARGNQGFDQNLSHIPQWVRAQLGERERELLADPGFPHSWLQDRAAVLVEALDASLQGGDPSRDRVDATVSFAERLRLVAVPRSTTVGWLPILLHYGHTVSGKLAAPGPVERLLAGLGDRLGLRLAPSDAGRGEPNGRWLVSYVVGVMDTDALSNLVFGELLVPLSAALSGDTVSWERRWRFPPGTQAPVAEYACAFARPFWGDYEVEGSTRTFRLPAGGEITETLTESGPTSYEYSASGARGYTASFAAREEADRVELTWSISAAVPDARSAMTTLSTSAATAAQMSQRLRDHFGPR